MRMTCTECGKVGNEDDLCELGEPCPDEECDGTMITWQPVVGTRHRVDDLDQIVFDRAALTALASLHSEREHAFVELCPGDATRYQIAIIGVEAFDRHYLLVATSFGPLVAWPDTKLHWDYVSSHMLDREHEWTARVITRFLNTVRYIMEAD